MEPDTEEQNAHTTASIVADRNCLVCRVTCQLSIETPGDSAHVFQRAKVDTQLIEVRAGEYMPLEETVGRDLEQLLVQAVERRYNKRMALYQRPQLYKFAPGATKEAAAYYLEDLCHAGLEEWRQVTVIGSTESSHNIIQEARILMRQIRFRDMWELRGPHMDMSNLLEQPAYGPTNNDTPEEDDTALEEPDAQIDNWEAEFAADLEAETELMQ